MSDVHFMNDYSEQTWFLEKARKRLKELVQGADQRFIEPLIEHFEEMDGTPYACCFSSEGDLLSQWRAYADDGAGFSIGFSSQWLQEQAKKYATTNLTAALWGVEYDDERQAWFLNHYIDEYLKSVKRDGKPQDPGRHALLAIWTLATTCKNHGFREENELRFVTTVPFRPANVHGRSSGGGDAWEMCFRVTGGAVIPYFVLPFPESAIAEIRLGPKNYARKDDMPLKAFLKANGFDLDRIRIIPAEAMYH